MQPVASLKKYWNSCEANPSIEEQFARYEQLKDQLTQVSTTKERKRIQKQIDEIESYLKEKSQQWVEDSDGIEYIKNPTKEDERKVNEWLDYINDFRDLNADFFEWR